MFVYNVCLSCCEKKNLIVIYRFFIKVKMIKNLEFVIWQYILFVWVYYYVVSL